MGNIMKIEFDFDKEELDKLLKDNIV